MDSNLMHKPDKLPTRAECKAMSKRLDAYLAIHKPQTAQQWAQQGAEYLALQSLQISVDFLKLQEALEGRSL